MVRSFRVCQLLKAARNPGEGTELRSEELSLVLAETFVNHVILSKPLNFGSQVVKLGMLFLSCFHSLVCSKKVQMMHVKELCSYKVLSRYKALIWMASILSCISFLGQRLRL